MRWFLLLLTAFGLTGATAVAQGVAPGGGIYNSTGIGSGLGRVIGGTGPSYPNGTTAPAMPSAVPPGGLPPVGHIDPTAAPPPPLLPPFASIARPNAWRTNEMVSGSKVEDQNVLDTLVEAPPIPTTSIFSRTDGICAWQACLNRDGPLAENIEVYGSRCGLGHNPAVIYAIADRLAQPEGA